jgi:head-tail adaptor
MSLAAGSLNCMVDIQQPGGFYPDGQPRVDGWTTYDAGVWAGIKGQTGLGTIVAAGDVPLSVTRVSIRLRYRTDLNAGMRVLEYGPDGIPNEGAPYDIKEVKIDHVRREWTDLICEQGANNG